MIDQSLYAFMAATLTTWNIEEGKIDHTLAVPFTWFRRSSTIQERYLSGALIDLFTTTFDVEMVSTDIDEVQSSCDTLKTALQSIQPGRNMGADSVQTFCNYIEVQDHSDDYISKSVVNDDAGYHLCTFQIRIIHRA